LFNKAIVRKPGINFSDGLTTAGLGQPDFSKALSQHQAYIEALENCGLAVHALEAEPQYPDGTFVEDVAVLTERCAILTHPGAPSRQGEEELIQPVLQQYFKNLHTIKSPGTLDGGDICQAENMFYIGISERTNESGALQLASILSDFSYSATLIDCRIIPGLLHLKTGMAYLGDQTFALAPFLTQHAAFSKYQTIQVDQAEVYAANCIRVNDHLLVAAGFPKFLQELDRSGFSLIPLEMSEFQKMDGGLSCLSLRF
jgi:dimethylargininase